MGKRYLSCLLLMLIGLMLRAQNNTDNVFALTTQNATCVFRGKWDNKWGANAPNHDVKVIDVKKSDEYTEVTYRFCYLSETYTHEPKWDKKFAREYSAKIRPDGTVEFINQHITIADALYDPRGYAFLIPDTLAVGQELECGEVQYNVNGNCIFGRSKDKTTYTIKYSSAKVVDEEDFQTDNGIIHCYKVQVHAAGVTIWTKLLSGKQNKIDRWETYWFAKGIGLVGVTYDVLGNYIANLKRTYGLTATN